MAASDIDQKYLGYIAHSASATHPAVAGPFYQVLGLSKMLSARVLKARKMRRLDLTRDTPSLNQYQHIIWMVREGLEILENKIVPHTMNGQLGAEATALTAKLRASLYHLLSLFHNHPPVSQVPLPKSSPASRGETTPGVLGQSHRHNNSKSSIVSEKFSPKANQGKSKNGSGGRTPTLRDPVASATSDTSFITNPYASNRPGSAVSSPPPPPGLGGPIIQAQPSAFLFPPMNFLPITESHFVNADKAATTLLPGSHPLRLSAAIEHCAFIWDCLHDFQYARRLARQTIRAVYHAKEGMEDDDFEEAAKMVDHLGKIMKRRSWDGAVRPVGEGLPEQTQEMASNQMQFAVLQEPLVEEEVPAQVAPPSIEFPEEPPTQESFVEQQYEKAGGGLRGLAYLDEHLRKPTTIQFQRSLKRRMPMNTQVQQVRNENDASPTGSLRCTHPLDPGPVDDQLGDLDYPPSDTDNECGASDLNHYDDKSFRMRKTGGPAPECCPNATSPRSSTAPPRPRPAPMDVEKANNSSNQLVDEYEWSPRKHQKKSSLLGNKNGITRFRNEAFPPLDGARLVGMPVLTQVPTPYQRPNGEIGVFQQWRWVQPVTVLDQEVYEAAVKKREEEWYERCRRKAYEEVLESGRAKGEELKGQIQAWVAQVATINGQQHM